MTTPSMNVNRRDTPMPSDPSFGAIPLPLRAESHRALGWLAVLTVLIPLLLFLPACVPALAENGFVSRVVTGWLPGHPVIAGEAAETLYRFLATTGRNYSLSFFTF